MEHTIILDRLGKARAGPAQAGRREALWADVMAAASAECPVEWVEAEAPAFLLYTRCACVRACVRVCVRARVECPVEWVEAEAPAFLCLCVCVCVCVCLCVCVCVCRLRGGQVGRLPSRR